MLLTPRELATKFLFNKKVSCGWVEVARFWSPKTGSVQQGSGSVTVGAAGHGGCDSKVGTERAALRRVQREQTSAWLSRGNQVP